MKRTIGDSVVEPCGCRTNLKTGLSIHCDNHKPELTGKEPWPGKGYLVYTLTTSDYVVGWELGEAHFFVNRVEAVKLWRTLREEAFQRGDLYSDQPDIEKEEAEAAKASGELVEDDEFADYLWGQADRSEGMVQVGWRACDFHDGDRNGVDAQTLDLLLDAKEEYEGLAEPYRKAYGRGELDKNEVEIYEANRDRANAIGVILEIYKELA